MVAFSVELVKEQKRICVKFCFKVRTTAAETHNMLCEADSDDASSQMMTYEWFNVLKMEELQWMMMSCLANLQLQNPNL
jgi:hypothetical protein